MRATLTETSDLELLFEQEAKRMWRALLAYSGDSEIADDAMAEAATRLTSMIGDSRL